MVKTDSDNWGQWMALAQGGDAKAYRMLLVAIEPWLKRYYSRRVLPGRQEDLVQECLIAVHRKRHTYDPALPFAPWLSAIARHKWIDFLRGQTRRAEVGLPEVVPQEAAFGDAVLAANALEKLLVQIRPKQAEALRLVKLEGLSIAEAAAASGQSEALVKVKIHRGMQQLTKLLETQDDDA